jgi:hypothetical protein
MLANFALLKPFGVEVVRVVLAAVEAAHVEEMRLAAELV